MTKAEENRKILQTSLDYTVHKKEVAAYGIVCIISVLVLILISLIAQSWRFLLMLIPIMLLGVPMSLIKLNNMVQILKNCEAIVFCETVLTDPQPSFNATIYFSVLIKDSAGNTFKAKTNTIASSRGLLKPHYTELSNKKALIAYKEVMEQVIVVKTW